MPIYFRKSIIAVFSILLLNVAALAKSADEYIEGVVLKGETARSILTQYMSAENFHKLYTSTKSVYDLSKIRQDYTYEIITNEDDGLRFFSYQFARDRKVIIRATDKGYAADIRSADYDIILKGSVLKDSETGPSEIIVPKDIAKQTPMPSVPQTERKTLKESPSTDITSGRMPTADLNPSGDPVIDVSKTHDKRLGGPVSTTSSEVRPKDRPPTVTMIPDIPEEKEKEINAEIRIDGDVKRGEHAQSIFLRCMDNAEFFKVYKATKSVYNLENLRVGQPYSLVYREQTGFVSFEYRVGKRETLNIRKDAKTGKYVAEVVTAPVEIRLAVVKGTVVSSLFKAVTDAGEKEKLAMEMAEIFSSEINFIRDLRKKDSFTLVVEKYYSDGRFQHYGRILGVRFVNCGTTFEGYRFPSSFGPDAYYNAKGESLAKSVLKAPLKFAAITSHYSLGRKHPIFKDVRKHQGVDYAAPEGTPVNSVSAGKVTKVGWGHGYGKMVVIRHDGELESQYSHLSRYASGLREGQRVGRGQLIGYVGKTGWATGPHLDFRLRRNGKFINPERIVSTRADSIAQKDMKRFVEQKNFVQRIFEGKYRLAQYKPGMIHLKAK